MELDLLRKFEDKMGAALADKARPERVYFRKQALDSLPFGQMLAGSIESEQVFAVDYYGLIRRSLGFKKLMHLAKQEALTRSQQVRYLTCPLVHFASITNEDVVRIVNPVFLGEFWRLKAQLLELRGFKDGSA